jgi:hypothetical protein
MKDITDITFNNLKVIKYSKTKNKNSHWICECLICGSFTEVSRPNLRSGNTKDCGCMRSHKISEISTTHGKSKTPTWSSWSKMKSRIKKGSEHSPIYGKINMDESWNSFENFLKDMGERPKGMTIDRIDNTKGYYKWNCRWATQYQQNRNRSTNIIINFEGESLCASDWAKKIGIHRDTIRRRLKRGLSIDKVLTK